MYFRSTNVIGLAEAISFGLKSISLNDYQWTVRPLGLLAEVCYHISQPNVGTYRYI